MLFFGEKLTLKKALEQYLIVIYRKIKSYFSSLSMNAKQNSDIKVRIFMSDEYLISFTFTESEEKYGLIFR